MNSDTVYFTASIKIKKQLDTYPQACKLTSGFLYFICFPPPINRYLQSAEAYPASLANGFCISLLHSVILLRELPCYYCGFNQNVIERVVSAKFEGAENYDFIHFTIASVCGFFTGAPFPFKLSSFRL